MARVRLPVLPARLRWAGVLAVAGGIALASVGPPPAGPPTAGPFGLVPADKWLHALGYLALGGTLAYALLDRGTADRDPRALAAAFLLAACYGLVIEAVQYPLPARAFDLADALANAAGAALAVVLWSALTLVVAVEAGRSGGPEPG